MLLQELLEQTPHEGLAGSASARIQGISYDSRTVTQGHLFVAIKGEKTDGNRYIHQAVECGAVAVASEQAIDPASPVAVIKVADARRFLALAARAFFADPAAQLKLVGITGTNGKTTTAYLMQSIFREAHLKSCLLGTIEMKIEDQALPSVHTTPEAPDLLLFLHQALGVGCTHGVMEVSSHALSMKRVYGTRLLVGIFTNLTPDHLDFHKTMEAYFQAKRILFTSEGDNRLECAAVNTDEPWGRQLAAEISCTVLRYGYGPEADVRILDTEGRIDGTQLRIRTPNEDLEIHSRLVGRPNTYNVLAALAAGIALGIEPNAIRRGIEALAGVPGRMERVDCGQPFTVLVDYAHTPDALARTLETIAQLPHQKVITLFGCGGDRDRTKRPVMGEIAARMSDFVIATSDNPRSEEPRRILAEIEPGLRAGAAPYRLVVDRRAAIGEVLAMAGNGDVVLIAGKGHEDCQVFGSQVFPFDDRVVAREILRQRPDVHGVQN